MELTEKDLDDILIALRFASENYTYESRRFAELERKIKRVREPFFKNKERNHCDKVIS